MQSGTRAQKAVGRKGRIKNLLKLQVSSFPHTTTQFPFAFPNLRFHFGRLLFWRLGSTAKARLHPLFADAGELIASRPCLASLSKNRVYVPIKSGEHPGEGW